MSRASLQKILSDVRTWSTEDIVKLDEYQQPEDGDFGPWVRLTDLTLLAAHVTPLEPTEKSVPHGLVVTCTGQCVVDAEALATEVAVIVERRMRQGRGM